MFIIFISGLFSIFEIAEKNRFALFPIVKAQPFATIFDSGHFQPILALSLSYCKLKNSILFETTVGTFFVEWQT
jgi:hypothetical protein